MKRIDTISELRQVWESLVTTLKRDLGVARRLATDPEGTMATFGYSLGPDAKNALLSALP